MAELAFSTNAYPDCSLPQAVDRIADIGYDGVEILADEPHAFLPDTGDDDRERLKRRLDDTGLDVSNINANTAVGYYDDAPPSAFFEPSLCTATDEDRRWRIEYTKDAVDIAQRVDAPAVSVTSGRPLPGNPPRQAREYLTESLHEILDYAEPRNIDVGIEFEPELLIECTAEVLDLIDELDRDGLGVNLDIGHAAVYGEDPAETVTQSADHITGIHLEDIGGGRRGKHYHRIPGEGDLDFEAIFAALDRVGYDGYATLELYTYPDEPDHAAEESLTHLAGLR
jgi:Sugar phosphate isomerases/epimerases